jgi:hypothetical protein
MKFGMILRDDVTARDVHLHEWRMAERIVIQSDMDVMQLEVASGSI